MRTGGSLAADVIGLIHSERLELMILWKNGGMHGWFIDDRGQQICHGVGANHSIIGDAANIYSFPEPRATRDRLLTQASPLCSRAIASVPQTCICQAPTGWPETSLSPYRVSDC